MTVVDLLPPGVVAVTVAVPGAAALVNTFVVTPLPFVVVVPAANVPKVVDQVTTAPTTGLPSSRLTVNVMVLVEVPLPAIDVGVREIVVVNEIPAFTLPAMTLSLRAHICRVSESLNWIFPPNA